MGERRDVTIQAPIAASGAVEAALPGAPPVPLTAEDENVVLRGEIRRMESEALTRDIALETVGTLLACAITQLLDGSGVDEIVFERELVRRMQAQRPHVEIREHVVGGDTVARLTFGSDGVGIGVGES